MKITVAFLVAISLCVQSFRRFPTPTSGRTIVTSSSALMSSPDTPPGDDSSSMFGGSGGRSDKPSVSSSDSKPSSMQMKIMALKAEAAKLRAEAAEFESVAAQERAEAIAEVFRSFDTNNDGEISLEEFKNGLREYLVDSKVDYTDQQLARVLRAFDNSGDGALQLEEFKGIDAFMKKLDELVVEEKDQAIQAQFEAREAAEQAKLEQAKIDALADILNDAPASGSDKIVSLIPYLFPLVDSIQYGIYMFSKEEGNPIVSFVVTIYAIYQAIPFSGLFAFFALSFLSGNMRLNRLIRFNMQQAILIDIALIIPGLVGGLATYCLPTFLNIPITQEMIATSSTLTFLLCSAMIIYSMISSLLGIAPDKIPFISDRVQQRVPTIDMFDKDGMFIGKDGQDDNNKKEKDKEDKGED